MALNDPRVPAAYPALDSAAFVETPGPPLDALILDTIGAAHNRLQAAGSPMFSLAVPFDTVTYGDGTSETYAQSARALWAALVPPFQHPKKPGHRFADYRLRVRIPSGVEVQFQVTTVRSPFTQSSDTTAARTVDVTGTGSLQTVSINGVPVDRGGSEITGIYVRSADLGSATTATYGSPISGEVADAIGLMNYRTQEHAVLELQVTGGGSAMSWDVTEAARPNDYGTRGYTLVVTDPSGNDAAQLQLASVGPVANNNQRVTFTQFVSGALSHAIRGQGSNHHTWKLYDPVRVALAGFAGATADRSP